jgi:hypothetical protein
MDWNRLDWTFQKWLGTPYIEADGMGKGKTGQAHAGR